MLRIAGTFGSSAHAVFAHHSNASPSLISGRGGVAASGESTARAIHGQPDSVGDAEALAAWHPPHTGGRGRSRDFADVAIGTGHLLRLAFARPWRQTKRLLRSVVTLLGS